MPLIKTKTKPTNSNKKENLKCIGQYFCGGESEHDPCSWSY